MKFVRKHRIVRSVAVLTASLLAISACGSDSESSSTTGATATTASPAASTTAATTATSTAATETTVPSSVDIAPAETSVDGSVVDSTPPAPGDGTSVFAVETDEGIVSLDAKPTKIVSLAPTHTETLFAIGAGDQVVAVDAQSNYPAEAAAVKSDLSGFTPNIEAIAAYEPDLVVISDNTAGLAAQLQALDIPVWVGSAADTLEEAFSEIQQLGTLTGHGDEASALLADMQADIDAILAEVPESEVPLTYYHELDDTYFSVTSDTFLGQLYSLANMQNIADQADADTTYPQLSSELIISANPDLIFLADRETAETVAARDGWSEIAAVKNGRVIEVDGDIASRWGPRVVDYLRAIVDAAKVALSVPTG